MASSSSSSSSLRNLNHEGGMECSDSSSPVKLSSMAMASTHGEDSPYFAGWKEYNKNPYHPELNPAGIIQMGLAENQVAHDLLQEWLHEHPEASMWQHQESSDFVETALFQDYHGLPAFKKALANFMSKVRGGDVSFDPDRIVLTAGATAANELLMFCLADPGDAVLVPTPYYPGFGRDLRWRTGVQIVEVPCHSSNNFELTIEALERAYEGATTSNITVRAILLTNPSNPLGSTMSANTLRLVVEFVVKKNMHLVCDEVYAACVFGGIPGQEHMVSIAHLLPGLPRSDAGRVHMVYSLSKDLGLPGFRVGVVYSYNDAVVATARRMSSFTQVSSQTQHMLAAVLSDSAFIDRYLCCAQARLRARHGVLVSGLRAAGVRCLPANAGLFCWVDLSHMLPLQATQNQESTELQLWNIILHDIGLNVSPGSSFRCSEPGWFRVCFANMSHTILLLSLRRIQTFISRSSPGSVIPRVPATSSSSLHRRSASMPTAISYAVGEL